MIFRAFSTAASKNRGEKFSGSGPNQLALLNEPAMSTQHRADGLGQRQPFRDLGQIGGPFAVVQIGQVAPAPHLGEDHVMLGKGRVKVADPLLVVQSDARAISGPIAELAMGQGELFRV